MAARCWQRMVDGTFKEEWLVPMAAYRCKGWSLLFRGGRWLSKLPLSPNTTRRRGSRYISSSFFNLPKVDAFKDSSVTGIPQAVVDHNMARGLYRPEFVSCDVSKVHGMCLIGCRQQA